MTNLQLLLSIGIPSLLIALSIIQSNARFAAMDKRMDGTDKRLDKIDADLVAINADLKQFYGMTTKLEGRMDEISKR